MDPSRSGEENPRVGVGIVEKTLDGGEDGSDVVGRAPAVLENVEAELAVGVDVGMEHLRDELDRRGCPVAPRQGELRGERGRRVRYVCWGKTRRTSRRAGTSRLQRVYRLRVGTGVSGSCSKDRHRAGRELRCQSPLERPGPRPSSLFLPSIHMVPCLCSAKAHQKPGTDLDRR